MREVFDDLSSRGGDRLALVLERPINAWLNDERMRQALHVVENAIKYGKPGTPITVRVLEAHGRLLLSVHNFGDPIPAADQLTLLRRIGALRTHCSAARQAGAWA